MDPAQTKVRTPVKRSTCTSLYSTFSSALACTFDLDFLDPFPLVRPSTSASVPIPSSPYSNRGKEGGGWAAHARDRGEHLEMGKGRERERERERERVILNTPELEYSLVDK